MQRTTPYALLGTLLLGFLALLAVPVEHTDDVARAARHKPAMEFLVATTPAPVVGDLPDVDGAIADSLAAFYADQQRQIDEYLAAVEAQRLADEEAARRAAAVRSPSSYRPAGTVGECTGFAIPDYIIQRESGGNPSAYNPSGAYGCAQTLLSHYYGGSCTGLDPYTIDGQRECVWRLSNGGTNLAPWAATR